MLENFIEIELRHNDNFLKIAETLTRIGVASERDKKLFQSCHILHKRGKYYLLHFKELFLLDGKQANITEEDIARRNSIAILLSQWSLCDIKNPHVITKNSPQTKIKIIPFTEKNSWDLVQKYTIGKKKKLQETS